MASIKVKFRPSSVTGQEGSIYYQVIHDRVPRRIPTLYKVLPEEWDGKRDNVAIPKDSERKAYLTSVRERIKWDLERLVKIRRRLEDGGMSFTSADICDGFRNYADRLSIVNYMGRAIIRLEDTGKKTTCGNYRSALNCFKRFLSAKGEDDIMLDHITSDIIIDFQAYLKSCGITRNTISFYMRILRAVYNTAVDDGLVEQRNPFRRVYTGVDKTVKRAIGLKDISRIGKLDLSDYPKLDYARDMFMLSFYFRGMSFVDMSYLKKSDLAGSQLVYCRRKTGQRLVIKWTAEMQEIVDKYPPNASEYLLPIIKSAGLNEHYVYRNALSKVNRNLKKIGEMAGLPFKLTHYVSRHSWASGAQSNKVPLSVISEALGHDSETTTQIYLASLDTSAVDNANDKMIKSVRKWG